MRSLLRAAVRARRTLSSSRMHGVNRAPMWIRSAYTPVHSADNTHTHTFNGPLSRTTKVSRYHEGKTNLDFTKATDSEWQWHQLGHMHVCTLLQTDNHTSTPPLSFLQAGCPSCRPTNSVKALKAQSTAGSALITLTGNETHTHARTHARTHTHTHTI